MTRYLSAFLLALIVLGSVGCGPDLKDNIKTVPGDVPQTMAPPPIQKQPGKDHGGADN
jgi:hypothetical protein